MNAAYDIDRSLERERIRTTALHAIAAQIRHPLLFGPDNRPLPSSAYQYSRKASKREGTMQNWNPRRIDHRTAARERHRIVERATELIQDNPYAAGIKNTFGVTVVGAGLQPHPVINAEALGITKNAARAIQTEQRAIYTRWVPWSDAGERMHFGDIQYLMECNLMQYGEVVVLPLMIDDPIRPYSLACQVISPQRLRTPTDKAAGGNIRDGVELDRNGTPVAYWIKKTTIGTGRSFLADTSKNYSRIPVRKGHRWQVLHRFIQDDAEMVRNVPPYSPALKFFQDLNDLLDAELVSSIVTAAFSMFVELTSQDPYGFADNMPGFDGYGIDRNNNATDKTVRYQELIPGMIMYGNRGEKPHPIAASRPGTTFDPFTKIIMKAIAAALNIPYVVLFKDVEGTNFAGFRSAMLEAWRVFMFRRTWLGRNVLNPLWSMLMEEAYLRRELTVQAFYSNMHLYTQLEWRGAPKGDIEPIKAAQADKLLVQANLKTRAEAIAERGGDWRATFDQLEEEQDLMQEKGLTEKEIDDDTASRWEKEENNDEK